MSVPAPHEVASAVAAVVSAIGGCAAALAAFRSARSAETASRGAEEVQRRAALRELSSTAALVVLEAKRVELRAHEFHLAAGSLDIAAIHAQAEITKIHFQSQAKEIIADAALFVGGAKSLRLASLEEIDRVGTRMSEHLNIVSSAREELERLLVRSADASARLRPNPIAK